MNIMSHRLPAPPPEPKYVLRDGMGPVSCVDFGSDDTLYAGTQDGCVHVWDLTINRRKSSFQSGNSVCLAVKAVADKIITQNKGDSISIWASSNGYELLHRFVNSYVGFCKVEIDCDRLCQIFIPIENSDVKVMNLNNYEVESTLSFSSSKHGEVMVMKSIQHLSHNLLMVGYESGDIYLWDLNAGASVSQFKIENVPMAVDFDNNNGKGVFGTESDVVIIFKIESDLRFCVQKLLTLTNPGVSAVTIRQDKKVLVLGCWDGNIRVYSWKSGRNLAVLTEHTETVNALCYSPRTVPLWGSVLLAAASKDKSISLWSFY